MGGRSCRTCFIELGRDVGWVVNGRQLYLKILTTPTAPNEIPFVVGTRDMKEASLAYLESCVIWSEGHDV